MGVYAELLCGVGISFGLYVGKTPQRVSDVIGFRLPKGASRADYAAKVAELRAKGNRARYIRRKNARRAKRCKPWARLPGFC